MSRKRKVEKLKGMGRLGENGQTRNGKEAKSKRGNEATD
jgi:hypothetical protein